MNLFSGVSLGRWLGVQVVLTYLFLIYAAFCIFNPPADHTILGETLSMVALFGLVLLHEFGHSLTCKAVGGQSNHIVLWPLGGFALTATPPRPWPNLLTHAAGPLVNLILIPIFYVLARWAVPLLPAGTMLENMTWLFVMNGLKWNIILFVFNMLPLYPMDGGRILQDIMWFFIGYPTSLLISGMIGTCGGISLIVLGLGLLKISIPLPLLGSFDLGEGIDPFLISIGFFSTIQAFQVYRHAEQISASRKN